jgi:hypothetical protein
VLDPRLYRAAFAPILLAIVVAAFSLVDRPRPLTTTLAPDAFDGARAFQTLRGLALQFPDRRPGSAGDAGLARVVERQLRKSFCTAENGCSNVTIRTTEGQTIDGEQDLLTVVGQRLGKPGPGIMVVAHRDAAGNGAEAELSGTAALLELARVFGGRRTDRTLTLVSTSGGSGGAAAARALAADMPRGDPRPAAVLVLGDMASAQPQRPWLLPWSEDDHLGPVLLRRTAEASLRVEAGAEPGQPKGLEQLARLAFPFAIGEEGAFNGAGVAAVAFSASGKHGPPAGAAVSEQRLRGFGRAALRTIDAIDASTLVHPEPNAEVVVLNKVLPGWVMRLLVGVLLLPMLVAAIDGFARVRRRRAAVAIWLRWLLGLAAPFVAALLVARLLGLTGMIEAPPSAVPAGLIGADGIALAIVAVAFVLGLVVLRPLHRWLAAVPDDAPAVSREGGGPASALTISITALAFAVWIFNPFAAAVLVLPAHLWMLAVTPEVRLRRAGALVMVVAALIPALLVLAVFASGVGANVLQLPWSLLLLIAGGQVGPGALIATCALGACALGAFRLALLPAIGEAPSAPQESIRGPMGYAGPGSLGGTASGFREARR